MPPQHERLTQHDLPFGSDSLAVKQDGTKHPPCIATLRETSLFAKSAREAADAEPLAPDRERRREHFTQAVDRYDVLELGGRVLGFRETELEEAFEQYAKADSQLVACEDWEDQRLAALRSRELELEDVFVAEATKRWSARVAEYPVLQDLHVELTTRRSRGETLTEQRVQRVLARSPESGVSADGEDTMTWVRDRDRNEVISRIRKGLNSRSDRSWSVTGGRGTSHGWLQIDSPPKRRTFDHRQTGEVGGDGLPLYELVDVGPGGYLMGPADRAELARLLGYEDQSSVPHQGVKVAGAHDYYAEFIDRAEGRSPSVQGKPYWD